MAEYALILAGGKGKRFWPMSRASRPKQFLPIVGSEPMIRQTFMRIKPLIPETNIFIVTSSRYLEDVQAIVPEIPDSNILSEPVGRNTAPAIAWAAEIIRTRDPGAVLAVLASDHMIQDEAGFRKTIESAMRYAKTHNRIVTLGIQPTHPETGYGYIKRGPVQNDMDDLTFFQVDRFVEKPNLETAVKYVISKDYYWNSGMFVFCVSDIMNEFRELTPDIYCILDDLISSGDLMRPMYEKFSQMPDVSIDYAIMEQSDRVAVVPMAIGWSDVGNWAAVFDHMEASGDGNRLQGELLTIDCRNTMIIGSKRMIAACGLDDIIIVDTADALLVCRKDSTQKISEIVEILNKTEKWEKYA